MSDSGLGLDQAKREIEESLLLMTFCMKRMGLSFIKPKDRSSYIRQQIFFTISVCIICYHLFSDIVYIGLILNKSPRIEDVVSFFHTFGYGVLSAAKMLVLWYKKEVFKQLIDELASIWPIPPLDNEAQVIKDKSLASLRIAHKAYFYLSVIMVWFLHLTPIVTYYIDHLWQHREDAQIGFIWASWYPFDKYQPIAHVAVYFFEMFIGQYCVWITTCTALLFFAMASHICLLLRLLQKRLESLAITQQTDEDYYQEILENIKLHQRLIRYCDDLEDGFSVTNLVNILISSVNISCVLFVIVVRIVAMVRKSGVPLIEPFLVAGNKLFLCAALIEMGVMCWYGDDILTANADVGTSAYNSLWYRTSPKCRRALLLLLVRSQKPVAFTAMKFTNMSLETYSSILLRSYSYFTLLYTTYSKK